MSLDISMKALLESGVHFGHRTNRWNPRMKPYIFTARNGIHIIDLQQTVQRLHTSYALVRDTVAEGGTVLFVGTKRQAQETIQMEAERCNMPYVVERWLPGTLTNWSTIYQRIMELERLEKMQASGEIDRLIKKEQLMIERKINRLLVHLSGIRHMNGLPDILFIVDIGREETAVHEANLKSVPVVAMVDTNCDPSNVDYLIPSNDDAIRAIKLMVSKIADAVIEGKDMRKDEEMDKDEYAAIGEDDGRVVTRGRIVLEEDVEDEELLGEATLRRLAEAKRAEEAAAEPSGEAGEQPESEAGEATEEAVEETPAEEAPAPKAEPEADTVKAAEDKEVAEEIPAEAADLEETPPAPKAKREAKTVKAEEGEDEAEVVPAEAADLEETPPAPKARRKARDEEEAKEEDEE
jgi:small subunit ribosomal protein S2